MIAMPEPDQSVIANRDMIVAGLRRLLPEDSVIANPDGLRAFETDALTAYRQRPLVVVLPRNTEPA